MNLRRFISICIIFSFLTTMVMVPQKGNAQNFLDLPEPGTMVSLSPSYMPVLIKGLKINPNNPLALDFIVATGNYPVSSANGLAGDLAFKKESEKLIKYFFAALTLPEKDVWVNLSPYEKDRIVPKATGETEMGRDMLAQDYILKQMTASLIYPEKSLGKEFWNRVYAEASERFGTTQVPVNTFNKVWIVADKASVYEAKDTVLVIDSHLKVMLEQDYLALTKHQLPGQTTNALGSKIVREIILPALEREVNQGKNFANLRQIFHSIILAKWYKETLKKALLNQVYSNKNKTGGLSFPHGSFGDPQYIYQQYLKAYKKGVFNYIKEDIDQTTQQPIPRKYFSGGVTAAMIIEKSDASHAMRAIGEFLKGPSSLVLVKSVEHPSAAMVTLTGLGPEYKSQINEAVEHGAEAFGLLSRDELANLIENGASDLGNAVQNINFENKTYEEKLAIILALRYRSVYLHDMELLWDHFEPIFIKYFKNREIAASYQRSMEIVKRPETAEKIDNLFSLFSRASDRYYDPVMTGINIDLLGNLYPYQEVLGTLHLIDDFLGKYPDQLQLIDQNELPGHEDFVGVLGLFLASINNIKFIGPAGFEVKKPSMFSFKKSPPPEEWKDIQPRIKSQIEIWIEQLNSDPQQFVFLASDSRVGQSSISGHATAASHSHEARKFHLPTGLRPPEGAVFNKTASTPTIAPVIAPVPAIEASAVSIPKIVINPAPAPAPKHEPGTLPASKPVPSGESVDAKLKRLVAQNFGGGQQSPIVQPDQVVTTEQEKLQPQVPPPTEVKKIYTKDVKTVEGNQEYDINGPEGHKIFVYNPIEHTLQSLDANRAPIKNEFAGWDTKDGWEFNEDKSKLLQIRSFTIDDNFEVTILNGHGDTGVLPFPVKRLLSSLSPWIDIKVISIDKVSLAIGANKMKYDVVFAQGDNNFLALQVNDQKTNLDIPFDDLAKVKGYIIGRWILIHYQAQDKLLSFSINQDGQLEPRKVFNQHNQLWWKEFGVSPILKGTGLKDVKSFVLNVRSMNLNGHNMFGEDLDILKSSVFTDDNAMITIDQADVSLPTRQEFREYRRRFQGSSSDDIALANWRQENAGHSNAGNGFRVQNNGPRVLQVLEKLIIGLNTIIADPDKRINEINKGANIFEARIPSGLRFQVDETKVLKALAHNYPLDKGAEFDFQPLQNGIPGFFLIDIDKDNVNQLGLPGRIIIVEQATKLRHMLQEDAIKLSKALQIKGVLKLKSPLRGISNAAMTQGPLNGGIDLNASKIDMKRQGMGVDLNFEPAMIAQFKLGNFTGIVPVITAITPIANIYPMLGLKEPDDLGIAS